MNRMAFTWRTYMVLRQEKQRSNMIQIQVASVKNKNHIMIKPSLLTQIKINVSVTNAEECYWLFTNAPHSAFDSK